MTSPLKKHPKKLVLLVLLVAAGLYSYGWTRTAHGHLDYRAALSLHLLSFTVNHKPDPDSDFEIPLEANLIYMLSDLLPKDEVAKVQQIEIAGDGVTIPARVYWPAGHDDSQPLPVIAYFHGGGFVVGSVDIFDALTRSLANATGAIVVSVDYRLAPAHPYPAAVDDCYAATRWVAENAASLGGDPHRIAVAGDSAGGNLSAAVALKARDAGTPALAAQIMYYPAVDLTDTPYDSKRDFTDGYGLSSASSQLFERAYVADSDPAQPYLSPVRAPNLDHLPPALVITGGFDPLTGSAQAYTQRLRDAGIPVTAVHYPDIIHGFMSVKLFSQRQQALTATADFLRNTFAAAAQASQTEQQASPTEPQQAPTAPQQAPVEPQQPATDSQ